MHKNNNHNSTFTEVRGNSDEDLNRALSVLNKKLDDSGLFKELSNRDRYIKKSKLNRQRGFDRLKSIQIAEKKRAELIAAVDRVTPSI